MYVFSSRQSFAGASLECDQSSFIRSFQFPTSITSNEWKWMGCRVLMLTKKKEIRKYEIPFGIRQNMIRELGIGQSQFWIRIIL